MFLFIGGQAHKMLENLRESFRRKLKAQDETKSSEETFDRDKLMFLNDSTAGNLSPAQVKNQPSLCDFSSDTQDFTEDKENLTENRDNSTGAVTDINRYNEPKTSFWASRQHQRHRLSKRRIYFTNSNYTKKWKTSVIECFSRLRNNSQDDEDLSFFVSLLPSMKKLSQTEKLKLRMKMIGLVSDALERNSVDKVENNTITQ